MPGWMPTPVEGLLNRPVMKFILALKGSMRGQALAQLHVRARALCPPVVAVDAVAHEQHGEPLGKGAAGPGRSALVRRPHRAPTPARAAPSSRPPPAAKCAATDAAAVRARWDSARRVFRFGCPLVSCMSPACASCSPVRLVRNWGLVTMLVDQGAEAVAVGRPAGPASARWWGRRTAAGCAPGRSSAACGTGCRGSRPGGARAGSCADPPRPLPSLPRARESGARVSTGRPPRSRLRGSPTGP